MLPLKDNVPTRSFPAVSVALIAVNVVVYLYEFFLWFDPAPAGRPSLGAHALRAVRGRVRPDPVPVRGHLSAGARHGAGRGPRRRSLTVLTSMFVHGGLLHVGGNMLYLWIFGKSVEDSMGHGRFLVFYLVCGLAAAAAQYIQDPGLDRADGGRERRRLGDPGRVPRCCIRTRGSGPS